MMAKNREQTIEERVGFNREARAIAEPYEKRIIEYEKAAIEYSKMILNMLYAINAGGLIGMPAILSIFNDCPLTHGDKAALIYGCVFGFGSGLICAALCALAIHSNFKRNSRSETLKRNIAKFEFGEWVDIYGDNIESARKENDSNKFAVKSNNFWTDVSFHLSHVFGWFSIGFFIFGCVWVAANFR
jgi:hypothetical protein